MIERLKAVIVITPLAAAILAYIEAVNLEDGQFAIASALFFLAFVLFVKNVYGRECGEEARS